MKQRGIMKNDRWRHAGVLLLLLACIVHLLLVFHFQFTQDDAYITFRYAANYLDGNGLVYNAGERVAGYTNFLWTILMIAGGLLGMDYVVFSRLLGIVSGIGTLVILYMFSCAVFSHLAARIRSLLSGACCLLLGCAYSFAYWTVAGLETAAFSFLALGSLYLYVRRSMLIIPALVVATLLRPEGVLLYLFVFACDIITGRSISRTARTIHVLYIVFLAPYLFFTLIYYGAVLPNPFYAKTNFGIQQVLNGLDYCGQYFYHYLAAGFLIIPVILVFRGSPRAVKTIAAFALLYTVYIVVVGGDVLKVHRFFVPIMPLFAMLVVFGIHGLLRKTLPVVICLLGVLVWQLSIPYDHVQVFHGKEIGLARKMNRVTDNLLAADNSDFSLAASTIGLVGFRLHGHTVIDLLGLTDSTIARHPEPAVEGLETTWRENKYNSAYVLSRQPDYILFSTGIKASAPAERALFGYSRFLDNFRTIPFYIGGALHHVYKRYHPVPFPIERDVDARFERFYNQGIGLWISGDFTASLAALQQAKRYSRSPAYPYVNYFIMLAHKSLGNATAFHMTINEILAGDTLVIEAYEESYYREKWRGNHEKAQYYRQKIKSLAPWYEKTIM